MSPMRSADYHPAWREVSTRMRTLSPVCEECGVPNGQWVYWSRSGNWMLADDLEAWNSFEAEMWLRNPDATVIRIVLTVAHTCDETTCAGRMCVMPHHLRVLCQRHHLGLDRECNAVTARETRRRHRIERVLETGQTPLETERLCGCGCGTLVADGLRTHWQGRGRESKRFG